MRSFQFMLRTPKRSRFVQKITIMTAACLMLCTNLSWAQDAKTSQNDELNRRARQEAQERQERRQNKDVFLQQKDTQLQQDISLPEETPSFVIHTLRLEGDKTEKFFWLQTMMNQYAEQRIGKDGINIIVKRLTNALIDRGYVTTRIVIPEQDISGGVLRLVLIPGVISDITFDNPQHSGNWQNAFPTKPGEILNLRDLEQGLEQLKRVPSQDADFKIVPGKQPGESAILIMMKENNPARAVFSLDDSGNEPTGKLQSSATLTFDNVLGINDLFNISFNKDGDRKNDQKGTGDRSIYYSFPCGNWTYSISSQHHDYHQTVQGIGEAFAYSGQSDNLQFKVEKLTHRDQTSKNHLEFIIERKHSKNYAGDTEIEVQRKNLTTAEVAFDRRQYFGQKILDIRLGYKRGMPWLGAQAEVSTDSGNPTTRYNIWLLEANYNTPVNLGKVQARYSTMLKVQYTDSILYTTDYFSIGNRYTVRGFDGEQTLAADCGMFIRNELSAPLGQGSEWYLGLDYGRVGGPGANNSGKELAGATIGFRGVMNQVNYEVFSSWALKRPNELTTATPAIGFQLIYQI